MNSASIELLKIIELSRWNSFGEVTVLAEQTFLELIRAPSHQFHVDVVTVGIKVKSLLILNSKRHHLLVLEGILNWILLLNRSFGNRRKIIDLRVSEAFHVSLLVDDDGLLIFIANQVISIVFPFIFNPDFLAKILSHMSHGILLRVKLLMMSQAFPIDLKGIDLIVSFEVEIRNSHRLVQYLIFILSTMTVSVVCRVIGLLFTLRGVYAWEDFIDIVDDDGLEDEHLFLHLLEDGQFLLLINDWLSLVLLFGSH